MKEYVEARVNAGSFSTPSEYLRTLIRDDQTRRAKDKLEGLLLEGLNSGKPIEVNEAFWVDLRKKVTERLNKKKRA